MTERRVTVPPTLRRFQKSDAFVRVIVGPVGSGKSSVSVREILRRAAKQRPGPDGVRRTRWVIIRNTYSQLRDTTRKTFEQWVPAGLGEWHEQSFTWVGEWFIDTEKTDRVHCEVLFRALDRPEDVKKLLSLEVTGAYFNELREIPKQVLDVMETRVGRYPSKIDGGASWFGMWGDTNPWHAGHWGAKLFARGLDGYDLFRQPGGRSPNAENVSNLPDGYYDRLATGKDSEYVKVYIDGEDASGDQGAVFGAWMVVLEKRGGVVAFDHPTDEVFTIWDLGKSDSTAIWFVRVNAKRQLDILDHYENAGQGLTHYLGILDAKPYRYAHHWLPHDAKAETLATQQTVFEQVSAHFGLGTVDIVPNIGLDDGIGAARWLLEQPIRIHERCNKPGRLEYSGLDALRGYRFEWDEKNQVFSKSPIHNWASHTADAWRYTAVVAKHLELMTRKPEPSQMKPPVRELQSFTLEELWDTAPQLDNQGRL